MNSNTATMLATVVTALATAALAYITYRYVKLTNSLLKEQTITRKINAIEKKLEKFYNPFKKEVVHCIRDYKNINSKYYLANQDYMKHAYLCQNKDILSILKKFEDTNAIIDEKDLKDFEKYVDEDIKVFINELNKLSE